MFALFEGEIVSSSELPSQSDVTRFIVEVTFQNKQKI